MPTWGGVASDAQMWMLIVVPRYKFTHPTPRPLDVCKPVSRPLPTHHSPSIEFLLSAGRRRVAPLFLRLRRAVAQTTRHDRSSGEMHFQGLTAAGGPQK